jgi:hypothetical protein
MIEHLLNQKAIFQPAQRDENGNVVMNNRGEIQYEHETDIPCRRESCMKEVLLPDKQIVRITDTFYTEVEVKDGDILEGKRAQYVESWVDGDGQTIGYKSVQ